MATIVEYLDGDALKLATVSATDSKRITIRDSRGKESKVAADRVLFEHSGGDPGELDARIAELSDQLDVELLWETVRDGQSDAKQATPDQSAAELASLYFEADGSAHRSAVFRALWRERVLFRRRGTEFSARSPDEVAQLRQKLEAEQRVEAELSLLRALLAGKGEIDETLAKRVGQWLRGGGDRMLDRAAGEQLLDAKRKLCWRLVDEGRLPQTTDPELLAANLKAELPEAAVAHAEAVAARPQPEATARAAFSIDDPETREVDDALSAQREGELVRVDVDIADVAAQVEPGDPVDLEARRRATTVYLPTGIYYMLPDPIGCDRGSLEAGKSRGVLRTSLWIDPASGEIRRHEVTRCVARVERRLDYDQADALLGGEHRQQSELGPVAAELELLAEVARARRQHRKERGALMLQRPEWKLRVDAEGHVSSTLMPAGSASRQLVAEMMIATNETIAGLAADEGLPIIFRAQAAPLEALPEFDPADPGALFKLRGLIKPAALSLGPSPHWGLGLRAYAQITSPLRRYGDLVQQRQLCAWLAGEPPPHQPRELLEVLATVERTEQDNKRLEAALTQRWALEHAAQGERLARPARITAQVKTGYKAQLLDSGAEGLLTHRGAPLQVAQTVSVDIERVTPRRGGLRMSLSKAQEG
jgi:exoribonuclease-2